MRFTPLARGGCGVDIEGCILPVKRHGDAAGKVCAIRLGLVPRGPGL